MIQPGSSRLNGHDIAVLKLDAQGLYPVAISEQECLFTIAASNLDVCRIGVRNATSIVDRF
jgi:hypothetical protein